MDDVKNRLDGVIDCAYESTTNISPVIPEANIFHLPFFILPLYLPIKAGLYTP